MKKPRLLIFIVCYQAERFIESVLIRIPKAVLHHSDYDSEILIIDDQSGDRTFERACEFAQKLDPVKITVLFNPQNQGYGGNQKIGYHYAINKGFDFVVLLHGDGQYAPEYLDRMVAPLISGKADVVLGSRLLKKGNALRGGMPLYKWIGNQVLTLLQNVMLGTNLSEFHTGYRAYSVAALASVPFQCNSDYFDFDTDIIIQMVDSGKKFLEIPIPTHYGQEVCRVDGIKYALRIIHSTFISRMMRFGLFYRPRFDYEGKNSKYYLKLGYDSSHQFVIDRIKSGMTVMDIGGGPLAFELSKRNASVILLDKFIGDLERRCCSKVIECNIETFDFQEALPKIDAVLLLDIIEHLKAPEKLLEKIRERFCDESPVIIITTGNIAFIFIRLALLFGQFNYGKRGILDLDHTRLFTFASLTQTMSNIGYDIQEIHGIPAPFPLAVGVNSLSAFLLRMNQLLIRLSPGLFSYQIALTARPKPTLRALLEKALIASKERRKIPG